MRRQVAALLGDAHTPGRDDPILDLDLLWLRVRTATLLPTPTTPEDVLTAWEDATRIELTTAQRAELAAEDPVAHLLLLGRHDLRARARAVVARTGMLDLDDWVAAPPVLDDRASDPPTRGGWSSAVARHLLEATVEDIGPLLPRRVLRAHLGLTEQAPPLPVDAARRVRARATLEVLRAASLPDRPAAHLRDALVHDATHRSLVRELRLGIPAATTLGMLGGRHEEDALRVAGEALTRWHRPPDLGRGVVVRLRS